MIIATRTSPADYQDEIRAGQQQGMAKRRAVAGKGVLFHDAAAVAFDQRAQQWEVCVIYLAARQPVSCLDCSVSEQAANARLCNHTNAGQPGGRKHADGGSREPVSRRDQPVAAGGLAPSSFHPAACNRWLGEDGPSQSIQPDMSQANDRIGSARQGVAGIDPAGTSGRKVAGRGRPLQHAWIVNAGADGLLSMNGNAVDSGPIDRWQVEV
jgi:hypothetical protein